MPAFSGLFLFRRYKHRFRCRYRNGEISMNILTYHKMYRSDQISRSVVSDSLRPQNRSTPGLPVHHQLPEFNESTLRMRWPKYWSFSFSIRISQKLFRKEKLSSSRIHCCCIIPNTEFIEFKLSCLLCNHRFRA